MKLSGIFVGAALAIAALLPNAALAQSGCSIFTFNNVPTAGQWNQCLQAKQDVLGYSPVNKAGDAMTGRLATIGSTTFRAGFAILPGVAPSAPVDGDMWTTTLGLYVRINGATVGPLTATGSTIPSVVQGDILYGSAPGTLSALAKNTSATRYLSNTGTSNNPAWAQVNLSNGVTGNLAVGSLATGTQDTVLGYFGSTTASALSVPNCGGALTYSTSTHTFGCNASGSVVATGTPVANQIAQWTNATTVQGVNLASLLNAGAGISITGTTSPTIALAFNTSVLVGAPANPTGSSSASAVMMGLGVTTCRFTPALSSRAVLTIDGAIVNNTVGQNSIVNIRYGTGAGPANGVAATGTLASGGAPLYGNGSATYQPGFSKTVIVTGLTPGVTIWFDLQIVVSGGTSTFNGLTCTAREV